MASQNRMTISRGRLKEIISEELSRFKDRTTVVEGGGIHVEGFKEIISDFVSEELSGWHPEGKESLRSEIEANGFDISDIIIQSLGDGAKGDAVDTGIASAADMENWESDYRDD